MALSSATSGAVQLIPRNVPFLLSNCLEFFDPYVADGDFGGGFDFYAEEAGLVVGGVGVVIDHDGHELAVDDLDEGAAAGDDDVFVPIVFFDEGAELGTVADGAHELFFGEAGAFDNLAAPGLDAHGGVFGIELAGPIAGTGPEVGLRASEHPIEIHGADVGGDVGRNVGEPGLAGLAAVLEATAASAFDLNLKFQSKIFGDHVFINEIGIAAGILWSRFANDCAVFDAPKFRVAVPAFESGAVEEGDVAFVVGEIVGVGEGEGEVGETATEFDEGGDLIGREMVGGVLDFGECVGVGVGEREFGLFDGLDFGVKRRFVGRLFGRDGAAGGGEGLGER